MDSPTQRCRPATLPPLSLVSIAPMTGAPTRTRCSMPMPHTHPTSPMRSVALYHARACYSSLESRLFLLPAPALLSAEPTASVPLCSYPWSFGLACDLLQAASTLHPRSLLRPIPVHTRAIFLPAASRPFFPALPILPLFRQPSVPRTNDSPLRHDPPGTLPHRLASTPHFKV